MRVLHVTASFPRSEDDTTTPFLLDLVRVQAAAGWEVAVIAAHNAGLPRVHRVAGIPVRRVRYAPDPWEVLAYRGAGAGALRHPAHAMLLPGLLGALTVATARAVRHWRPDVINSHWLLPGGLVAALTPVRGARRVVTLHGGDVAFAAGRGGAVARWAAARNHRLVAVSQPLAAEADRVLRRPEGAIGVARLPLADGLAPSPLPSGPWRLLAAGRASAEKGFDVLLRALARPGTESWGLTLLTAGPDLQLLRQLAAPLGDRVTLMPPAPRPRLFEMMADHHAVAVPSRREGLGLLALEALAAGRPVIASAVGGLTEVVEPGRDGVLVPPDDAEALGTALASFRPYSPAGAAAARHTPEAVLPQWEAAYSD